MRRHESAAEVLLEDVDPRSAWEFLRDPGSARVLLPEVVEAGVVSGCGLGERLRYVARDGRRESIAIAEVTALVPGRLLELTLLNRPYDAARRFEFEEVAGGTLLRVRSWALAGWSWFGLRRTLQEDDDEYVRRVAQVLPVLRPACAPPAGSTEGGART